MTNLSDEARSALFSTKSGAQGTKVTAASLPTLQELRGKGLIGLSGGLTMRGSIVRDRVWDEELDRAFG